MAERVVQIQASPIRGKKYRAFVSGPKGARRSIDFGAVGYEQFKDSTKIGKYRSKDHGDKERRRRYFMRFSGTPSKRAAIAKEKRRSGGRLNAKILSHQYLW